MSGSTECIVSVGSAIKLQWTQTRDGSINISIRLIAGSSGPQKRQKKNLLRHTESWNNKNRTIQFQLAAASSKTGRAATDDAEDENGSKGGQPDGEDDQNSESEDDQNSENEDTDDNTRLTSRQDDDNSVPIRAPCEVCREIRKKIEKKSCERPKRLLELQSLWMRDPGEFFGGTLFSSSVQWSFRSLTDCEQNLDQERSPFHKVNLAYHLQKRVEESKFPELNCRKMMLQEIYPGFEKLQRVNKGRLYQRFERYLNQGQALILVTTGNAGVLLTVAGFLTRAE